MCVRVMQTRQIRSGVNQTHGMAVMVNLFGCRFANPPGGGLADEVAKYLKF